MSLVSSGPCFCAIKDNIFHGSPAHGFSRIRAHNPTYGFKKIRFSAPIRANNPCEPGLDQELGRLDKGFKPRQLDRIKDERRHGLLGRTFFFDRNLFP